MLISRHDAFAPGYQDWIASLTDQSVAVREQPVGLPGDALPSRWAIDRWHPGKRCWRGQAILLNSEAEAMEICAANGWTVVDVLRWKWTTEDMADLAAMSVLDAPE